MELVNTLSVANVGDLVEFVESLVNVIWINGQLLFNLVPTVARNLELNRRQMNEFQAVILLLSKWAILKYMYTGFLPER